MEFHHISVLPQETIRGLVTDPAGTYVDCTLGGAGHAGRIAARLTTAGRIIGIDQDAAAIAAAKEHLAAAACRVDIVHDNFRNLEAILAAQEAPLVDGVLFDLGVSSYQLDTAERGFSYMQDAPLDMRMDPEAKLSAYEVVNEYEEAQQMRYVTSFERHGMEKGLQQGMQQGIEQGLQQGMQQGIQQGLQQGALQQARDALFDVLIIRFQQIPIDLLRQIEYINNVPTLKMLLTKAVISPSLEAFEQELLQASAK